MDEKFKKQLEENGADVKGTLQRFMGNETLYIKFLMKFLDDTNYAGLKESIAQKDYTAAFNHAHTLKGVSANLGLNPVCAAVTKISDSLKNKPAEEVDAAQIDELFGQFEEVYTQFFNLLQENRQ
ncbi:MAG: Hpt domain-containing protein [Clostridium sp.]|nr:Hpt domain-containing protein [Acetatifactor muris]MCM1563273.1 Hpt domain-containing protein [Clostridium sp.]